MPSDEALRAAKAIRAEKIRSDRPSSVEADAEIIDLEFREVRRLLDEDSWELEAVRAERDKLRKALVELLRRLG